MLRNCKYKVRRFHDGGNAASEKNDGNMVSFVRFVLLFSDKSTTTLRTTALVTRPDQTILSVPQREEENSKRQWRYAGRIPVSMQQLPKTGRGTIRERMMKYTCPV